MENIFYEDVRFPENCKGFIDVTKDPWNLDPTGKEDCTEKLCTLLDTLLKPAVDEVKEAYRILQNSPDGTFLTRGNRRLNGRVLVICPQYIALTPIIYFPNGTYLISDTVSYRIRDLHNMMYHYSSGGYELNRCIRFMGQSRDKTILKLKDYCKGFEWGQKRIVLDFMRGTASNVAMSNYVENMTIDVGIGNPGAIGLHFFANNSGMVRHVKIMSSDPNHDGAIGFLVDNSAVSACNLDDVEIDGFAISVAVREMITNVHIENLVIKNPTQYGVEIHGMSTQIINMKGYGDVPMVYVTGESSHAVVVNAEFESNGTEHTAIKYISGCVFLRNIHSKGFKACYEENWFEKIVPDGYIKEYSNFGKYVLFDAKKEVEVNEIEQPDTVVTASSLLEIPDEGVYSLNMEVPPLPQIPFEHDFSNWACVNDFGATGDGETDDTKSIQQAMNSGKSVIYFNPGRYLLSGPIDIPENVKQVQFFFTDLRNTPAFAETENEGIFHILGDRKENPDGTSNVLLIEKLFSNDDCFGKLRMFQHDGTRSVFFKDCHTQATAFYFNTVPGGEVFFENCACTIGDRKIYHGVTNFEFHGQTVWCHSINPERSDVQTLNDGGKFWWSGFKTEQKGYICYTENGGVSEILGGCAVAGAGVEDPLIYNEDSDVCAIFCNNGYHQFSTYPVPVKEVRNGISKVLRDKQMPARNRYWYFMPLYVGHGKKN